MSHYEPVLFDSIMLETANEAVLYCKTFLEKEGYVTEANELDGLGPVVNEEIGELALEALRFMRTHVEGKLLDFVNLAIETTKRALRKQQLTAAA